MLSMEIEMNRGKKSTLINWESDFEFDEFYDYQKQKQQELKVSRTLRRDFKQKDNKTKKQLNG